MKVRGLPNCYPDPDPTIYILSDAKNALHLKAFDTENRFYLTNNIGFKSGNLNIFNFIHIRAISSNCYDDLEL